MKRGLVYLLVLGVFLVGMVALTGGGKDVTAGTCNCYLPYLSTSSVLPTSCVITNASGSDNVSVTFRMVAGNNNGSSLSTSEITLGGMNDGDITQFQFKTGGIFNGVGSSATVISAANTIFSNLDSDDGRYSGILSITDDDTDGDTIGSNVLASSNSVVTTCPNVGVACFQSSPNTTYKSIKRNLFPVCLDVF